MQTNFENRYIATSTDILHFFSLIGYSSLSYFYFVDKNFAATVVLWLILLLAKIIAKPLRQQAGLIFLVGVCFAFVNLLHRAGPWLQWPLDFFLATVLGFAILRFGLRKQMAPLKWSFNFSKREIASIGIINIPAIGILIWYYQLNPDVANMWPLPSLPFWSLPFVVIATAGINGLREEIFYRGLLQTASPQKSPVWFAIGLQAVLFGFLHFTNSFPQGWLGVLMTAAWGAAIAIQYHIFRSISLAWVTHAIADAIMFSIIIYTRAT